MDEVVEGDCTDSEAGYWALMSMDLEVMKERTSKVEAVVTCQLTVERMTTEEGKLLRSD